MPHIPDRSPDQHGGGPGGQASASPVSWPPLLLAILLWLCSAPFAWPTAAPAAERPAVGVCLAGRPPVRVNADTPFVPASTVKILTALIALETLGPDHRFTTSFFLDRDTLWIKGSGAPILVSEEVRRIAERLRERGLPEITAIGIDESAFDLEGPWPSPSANPYDAAPAALLVNFGTVFVERRHGRIVSAEPQTPTLPLMRILGTAVGPGEPQRLNVNRFGVPAHRYAGELFRALLGPRATTARIVSGRIPPGCQPFYQHRSERNVRQAVAAMLRFSTNVIANQLFLASGAAAYGQPATWGKARRLAREFLARAGVPPSGCAVREGSGLSRRNRMTPRAMIRILRRFAPYRDLLPARGRDRVKSGTLAGVANYAGYLACNGDWLPFTIFTRGRPRSERDRWLNRLRLQCGQGAGEKTGP